MICPVRMGVECSLLMAIQKYDKKILQATYELQILNYIIQYMFYHRDVWRGIKSPNWTHCLLHLQSQLTKVANEGFGIVQVFVAPPLNLCCHDIISSGSRVINHDIFSSDCYFVYYFYLIVHKYIHFAMHTTNSSCFQNSVLLDYVFFS